MFRRTMMALIAITFFANVIQAEEPAKLKKLLLVTHSGGFVHGSVGHAEDVLKKVGPKYGFEVTCFRYTGSVDDTKAYEDYQKKFRARTGKTVEKENCGRINAETLAKFDAVLFFTTGNPLTPSELKDLTNWVKKGGAFTGTHCATDTLYKQPTYGDLIGGYFRGHPSGYRKVKLNVEDPKHPAATFENGLMYEDEIYIFRDDVYSRDNLHIILSVTPGSFDPGQRLQRKDGDYAISWCKNYGKGKVFYTSFGHKNEVWDDEKFQKHLFGGIKWATGDLPGDATPTNQLKK